MTIRYEFGDEFDAAYSVKIFASVKAYPDCLSKCLRKKNHLFLLAADRLTVSQVILPMCSSCIKNVHNFSHALPETLCQ